MGARIVRDTIDDVAPNEQSKAKYPGNALWLAESQVLAPRFVNTHTHLCGTGYRL